METLNTIAIALMLITLAVHTARIRSIEKMYRSRMDALSELVDVMRRKVLELKKTNEDECNRPND